MGIDRILLGLIVAPCVSLVCGCQERHTEDVVVRTGSSDRPSAAVSNDSRQPGDIVERTGEPDVIYVDDNDPKMLAAIDKARARVRQFIDALNRPKPSQTGFAVKAPISDGKAVEHMWLAPVRYTAGKFSGTVNNDPDKLTTVKLGDRREVKENEISDWMYLDDGKLVGGYTIRVLRDAMPVEKRREWDRSVPFKID